MSAPEWLDYASTIGTVAAAGLAVWAIQVTKRQARENTEALLRERRADFYLDRLLELMEGVEKGRNVAFADQTVRLALKTLPDGILPMVRAYYDLGASQEGRDKLAAAKASCPEGVDARDFLRAPLRDEVATAVKIQLDDRGTTIVSGRLASRSWRSRRRRP